ncbi:hypothetical protein M011DRAFT_455149 [Sporormia fimetaria CBS 119925]|uniref:Uncharacterized protein n=1 Tax=Sporormia fimetaria CBS 119925 TaxID=1340428 RepID=A0A6A6VPF8_9PLEO|nr:hypothetical protein M011DRAFT_455149 [Sporormia fimetaria CBS 119925]
MPDLIPFAELYGEKWIGQKFNPLFDNIRTGALHSGHHCKRCGIVTKECYKKGHMAFCSVLVNDHSTGCGDHSRTDGFNDLIYNAFQFKQPVSIEGFWTEDNYDPEDLAAERAKNRSSAESKPWEVPAIDTDTVVAQADALVEQLHASGEEDFTAQQTLQKNAKQAAQQTSQQNPGATSAPAPTAPKANRKKKGKQNASAAEASGTNARKANGKKCGKQNGNQNGNGGAT